MCLYRKSIFNNPLKFGWSTPNGFFLVSRKWQFRTGERARTLQAIFLTSRRQLNFAGTGCLIILSRSAVDWGFHIYVFCKEYGTDSSSNLKSFKLNENILFHFCMNLFSKLYFSYLGRCNFPLSWIGLVFNDLKKYFVYWNFYLLSGLKCLHS